MIYKFIAYGHPNILATHKTTLEFTKDEEVSLNGDCIAGVKADFDLKKIKKFISKSDCKNVTITIKPSSEYKKYKKIEEIISAEINPDFNNEMEFVIRKTDFLSNRTFAINSNKAAFDLNIGLIDYLKEKKKKIQIIVENKEE